MRLSHRPATHYLRVWLQDLLQPLGVAPEAPADANALEHRVVSGVGSTEIPGQSAGGAGIGDRLGEVRLTREQDVLGASPEAHSSEGKSGRTDGPQATVASAGPVIRRFAAALGDGRFAQLLGKDSPRQDGFGTRGEERTGL